MTNRDLQNMTPRRRWAFFSSVLVALLLFSVPAFAAPADGFPVVHWLVSMVNVGIFLWIIVKYGGPHIQKFFANRRDVFLTHMNAAKRAREEAEARLDELNEKIEALEKERQALLDEYHAQGEREKQRIIETAKRQVEKMRQDAEATIDQEVKRAVAMLEEQAVDLAVEMARKKAVEKLDEKAQEKLFEGYLADLESPEASVN